jgi:molybdate transport system substrate-binding protein
MGRLKVSVAVIICLTMLAPAARGKVLVFAAASTAEALAEVNRGHAATGGATVAVSFGSSGILARQIENGAPADLFVSANTDWIDYLSSRARLSGTLRRALARNRLALVAPRPSTTRLAIAPGMALVRALDGGRLAIADPRYVPAGSYARAALIALGVWNDVARRTAVGRSVRETLMLVERGEAPLGVVYATDAAASAKVRLVGVFPAATHPPITYWVAVVAGRERPAVTAYFRHLGSDAAGAVFRRHGFVVD